MLMADARLSTKKQPEATHGPVALIDDLIRRRRFRVHAVMTRKTLKIVEC